MAFWRDPLRPERTIWVRFIHQGREIGYVAICDSEIRLVSGSRAAAFLERLSARAGEPPTADLIFRILTGECSIGVKTRPREGSHFFIEDSS